MPDPNYTIVPIRAGSLDLPRENLTLKRHQGETVEAPCIIWVVRGGGRTFIVDSGPGDVDAVRRITGRTLKQTETPPEALERLHIDPKTVDGLVLSHLHWDHAGGLDIFPTCPIFVHRLELHTAIAPLPIQARAYEWEGPEEHVPRWIKHRHRMTVLDREIKLAPGLRILHLPGHTPGCIGLCCATRAGQHLIACDAVPTYENLTDNVPPGWYSSLDDAYATLGRIRESGACVLPSHDARVFDADVYPRGDSG
jgi:N-acyl homoserine lactone hydrolase